MNLKTGVRLLKLLTSRPEHSMSTQQILRRWTAMGGPAVDLRSIQRYMVELSQDTDSGPALVATVLRGGERCFHLKASQVANWFITEEAALDLQLSRDVFGRSFGARHAAAGDKLADMAELVAAATPETRRIRDRLRIAPDGIGRLPAAIHPEVLRMTTAAIAKDRKLQFNYRSAAGKASTQLVSPLGMVAKDGTIYLVAVKGLSDAPWHFNLHRMADADVHFQQAQPRPDFDLQRHIADSHQFSHVLDAKEPLIELRLRVAPDSIYHFKERPLSMDQQLVGPCDDGPWFTLTATVPRTILLVPFLVSMGRWIEVIAPVSLRSETAEWIRQTWYHYADDGDRRVASAATVAFAPDPTD